MMKNEHNWKQFMQINKSGITYHNPLDKNINKSLYMYKIEDLNIQLYTAEVLSTQGK